MSRIEEIAGRLETLRLYREERGAMLPGWSIPQDADYLLARVRSLEATLTWYADAANYNQPEYEDQNGLTAYSESDVQLDSGERARSALAGESR